MFAIKFEIRIFVLDIQRNKQMNTLTQFGNVPKNDRDGYVYRRYIQHGAGVPFNFLTIDVYNGHPTKKVLHGIRNYYVVTGRGVFTIEGLNYEVFKGDLITIQPGESYSYYGTMGLVEFNIDTGDGIAHEDVE